MFLVVISFLLFFGLVVNLHAWDANNKEHVIEYIHYIAEKEDVPVQKVLKIAKCESGFNKDALNHTDREYSVGIFQINLKAHTYITEDQARNPFFNIGWAVDRMREGKWSWWTCANMA